MQSAFVDKKAATRLRRAARVLVAQQFYKLP
jgi:hypothetical protein